MYKTIKRLYDKTGDEAIVRAAVEKQPIPWITKEQYKGITGKEYK